MAPSFLIFLPSRPMSAIQLWPQELVQPVTCSLICWSKPGRRSSISLTSHLEKALVSAMASLQNSVPVQAMAPRQKGDDSTCRPISPSACTRSRVLALGTLTRMMFCMMVARSWPSPILLGEIGQLDQLLAGEASAQDACAHGGEAGLQLRRYADVVAIDVVGNHVLVDRRGIEFVAKLGFDGLEHGLGGPAVAHEEVLDARAGAVLAQLGLLLEDA